MNMLYEGLKQNSTIVIVPSSAVETMQLGGLAGLTALTMGIDQDRAATQAGDTPISDASISIPGGDALPTLLPQPAL